jgi:hypothetical protein
MPTYAHQFEHYLYAFHELGVAVAACKEWKPGDVGYPAALQALKRGAAVTLTLEFSLQRRLV